MSQDLKKETESDQNFLTKAITSDESWGYGYDTETKQASSQWKIPNSPKPKKAREVRLNVKLMVIIFFYVHGIAHREFAPPGQTVNQRFYLEVLRRL